MFLNLDRKLVPVNAFESLKIIIIIEKIKK